MDDLSGLIYVDSKAKANAETPESIIVAVSRKRSPDIAEEAKAGGDAVINTAADIPQPLSAITKLASASAVEIRSEAPLFDRVPEEEAATYLIGPIEFLKACLDPGAEPRSKEVIGADAYAKVPIVPHSSVYIDRGLVRLEVRTTAANAAATNPGGGNVISRSADCLKKEDSCGIEEDSVHRLSVDLVITF
jgi:hypothetical protein